MSSFTNKNYFNKAYIKKNEKNNLIDKIRNQFKLNENNKNIYESNITKLLTDLNLLSTKNKNINNICYKIKSKKQNIDNKQNKRKNNSSIKYDNILKIQDKKIRYLQNTLKYKEKLLKISVSTSGNSTNAQSKSFTQKQYEYSINNYNYIDNQNLIKDKSHNKDYYYNKYIDYLNHNTKDNLKYSFSKHENNKHNERYQNINKEDSNSIHDDKNINNIKIMGNYLIDKFCHVINKIKQIHKIKNFKLK